LRVAIAVTLDKEEQLRRIALFEARTACCDGRRCRRVHRRTAGLNSDYNPLWEEVWITWKKGVKPVLRGQDDQIDSLVKKGSKGG
jgi:hypothetical protein